MNGRAVRLRLEFDSSLLLGITGLAGKGGWNRWAEMSTKINDGDQFILVMDFSDAELPTAFINSIDLDGCIPPRSSTDESGMSPAVNAPAIREFDDRIESEIFVRATLIAELNGGYSDTG